MNRLQKTVHLASRPRYGRLAELAPDVTKVITEDGGEPFALGFQDPDGETHVFVLTEEKKKVLLVQMAGGIVPATAADVPK